MVRIRPCQGNSRDRVQVRQQVCLQKRGIRIEIRIKSARITNEQRRTGLALDESRHLESTLIRVPKAPRRTETVGIQPVSNLGCRLRRENRDVTSTTDGTTCTTSSASSTSGTRERFTVGCSQR